MTMLIYTYVYTGIRVCAHMYKCACMCSYVCVYMHICRYVNMYIWVCMHGGCYFICTRTRGYLDYIVMSTLTGYEHANMYIYM